MGKTYIDTVKYIVYANVEIGGLVEKPDVVGAVFGQTEGLLGDELDLRELQKNGRIGRIEVDLSPRGGKSVGKIRLPSSLDMVETCILAAALETVDRVGPCEAHLSIDKVEDQRSTKRKVLVDRAKSLLKNLLLHEIPESKEISEQVRSEVKTAEIAEYGPEKLPAGPGVADADSIILVEGRADVINLLKNDINNVVGVGGANVAPSVAKLCREKEVTVFLDGDRGGDIILAELTRIADVEFVARAPTGKEVEELTRKELIKCLRSKVPYEQGSTGPGQEERQNGRYKPQFNRGERGRPAYEPAPYAAGQSLGASPRYEAQAQSNPAYNAAAGGSSGQGSPAYTAQNQGTPSFGAQNQAAFGGAPGSDGRRSYSTRSGDMVSGRAPRERRGMSSPAPSAASDGPLINQVAEGIVKTEQPGEFSGESPGLQARGSRSAPAHSESPASAMEIPPGPASTDAQPSFGSGAPEPACEPSAPAPPALASVPAPLLGALAELEGSLKARFYSPDFALLKEIPVRDMIRTLEGEPEVYGVVFDGIITQRLADLAESKKAAALVGVKLGNVFRKPAAVLLYTKN